MYLSSRRFGRLVALLAAFATIAVGLAPVAAADDWARDRAVSAAYAELDPAIRAAIASRAGSGLPASHEPTLSMPAQTTAPTTNGFAWSAAALGVLIGVGAMCLALACVTLVRHGGRLRSA